MNYKEIKKDFLMFPLEFDEEVYKRALLASIDESKEIITLTNELDIKNDNGDYLNLNYLVDVVKKAESKERLMSDRGIYATEIDGDPVKFLSLALAFILSGDAVIISVDVRNYGTVNLMAVLMNTVLEEMYGLKNMVSIYNGPASDLKDELVGTDAILFCI